MSKLKYKGLKNCELCDGTGYFISAMDFPTRCNCYKQTKEYKTRNNKVIKKIWHDALSEPPKKEGYIFAIIEGFDSKDLRLEKIYYTNKEDDCSYKADKDNELSNCWNILVWSNL